MSEAHRAGVLQYLDYAEESPCQTNYETWTRILKTTEKSLVNAMREEISKKVGWK